MRQTRGPATPLAPHLLRNRRHRHRRRLDRCRGLRRHRRSTRQLRALPRSRHGSGRARLPDQLRSSRRISLPKIVQRDGRTGPASPFDRRTLACRIPPRKLCRTEGTLIGTRSKMNTCPARTARSRRRRTPRRVLIVLPRSFVGQERAVWPSALQTEHSTSSG
jgi:hypothetical protein